MNARELVLHISANLGRLCRFALEGREGRVIQFIKDTDWYVGELENAPKNKRFIKTFTKFRERFSWLKKNVKMNEEWAEEALTWANILTHRAKLA